jgi:peptidoglycan/xylan/chitin deacetylase (PgdA/CDA1 family)
LQDKITFILQNGMDIGNHTVTHKNLGAPENQKDLLIQKEIGKQAQFLETLAGNNYKVDTIALCHGGRPKKEHHKYIIKGEFNNIPYQNSAILNVGSKPALSPFDENFNPAFISRVRASTIDVGKTGLYNWLNHFIKHPEQRYIQ